MNVETIEARRLLSAVVESGVLHVTGSATADQIEISPGQAGSTKVSLNGAESQFNNSDFTSLLIEGLDGDDTIAVDDAILTPAKLLGGDGNDSLTGGGGDDALVGGLGNDTLAGGGTYDAPGGINTADYSDRTEALQLDTSGDLQVGDSEVDSLGQNIQRFLAGSGDDSLQFFGATPGSVNYVDAGAGNDTVNVTYISYQTDVTVHGGAGDDDLLILTTRHTGYYLGDAGNDTFLVYRSSWTSRDFHGGDGIDTVDYSGFISQSWAVKVTIDDVADDGAYAEYFQYSSPDNVHTDNERIIGNSGDDTLIGSDNSETLIGGDGNDSISGNGGDDSLEGDDGNDTLIGGDGTDTLNGGEGRNTLFDDSLPTTPPRKLFSVRISDGGIVRLSATEQADSIVLGPSPSDPAKLKITVNGEMTVYAMADVNQIIIDARGGDDVIDLKRIAIASKIYGGAGNETVYGSAAADRIYGGDGNDWISAGAGNDIVYGEAGNDRVFGGDGTDHLYGGTGKNLIRGEGGRDVIAANKLLDDLHGNGGDMLIQAIG